jgi:hypothetical protein
MLAGEEAPAPAGEPAPAAAPAAEAPATEVPAAGPPPAAAPPPAREEEEAGLPIVRIVGSVVVDRMRDPRVLAAVAGSAALAAAVLVLRARRNG